MNIIYYLKSYELNFVNCTEYTLINIKLLLTRAECILQIHRYKINTYINNLNY